MTTHPAHDETRILVQTAARVCEEKKGEETRILELDPVDSGLADFFLITSTLNERQSQTIADEIELRLKREYSVLPASVEGRRQGEWILLDYVDFVVHVFLAERRAFYDIERLRKSARPISPAEFDEELKAALAARTRAARRGAPARAAESGEAVGAQARAQTRAKTKSKTQARTATSKASAETARATKAVKAAAVKAVKAARKAAPAKKAKPAAPRSRSSR